MSLKYAIKGFDEEKMAKARVNNVPVSLKVAIEISNMIRGKKLETAKNMLEEVIVQKRAVPYKRFGGDVGHKTGMGPGRYPEKASTQILKLLKLVESNAQETGLSTELMITHLVANKGTGQWKYGRQRRRKQKQCHIEVAVEEAVPHKKKEIKKEAQSSKAVGDDKQEKKEVKSEEKKEK